MPIEEKQAENFWACPSCTYHNGLGLSRCEMCSAPRKTSDEDIPQLSSDLPYIKLSFRGKGSRDFHEKLLRAVEKKEWEKMDVRSNNAAGLGRGAGSVAGIGRDKCRRTRPPYLTIPPD